MSKLDEELAQAVTSLDKSRREHAGDALPSGSDAADDEPKKSWGLLIGIGVAMAAVLTLFFSSSDDAVVYAYGVDELAARSAQLGTRQVRVEGHLVSGTLVKRDNPCEYRFQIQKGDEKLMVHYAQCVVPDTFRDVKGVQVDVTAEGRLNSEGQLDASKIFAKCPSKYEMREGAAGGAMPEHGGGAAKPEFIEARTEDVR